MSSINEPQQQSTTSASPAATSGGNQDMPIQRHAGQVGYGPNYKTGASLEDKMEGLKEEIKGKLFHNPDRVQHGHDLMSGEEKRKKLTGEDEPNPFQNAKDDDKDADKAPGDADSKSPPATETKQLRSESQSSSNTSETLADSKIKSSTNVQANPAGMAVDQGHGPGAREQAATVAPEGTHEANVQKEGDAADRVKHIDEQHPTSVN